MTGCGGPQWWFLRPAHAHAGTRAGATRRLQAELAARLMAALSTSTVVLLFDAAMACNDEAMGDATLRFVLEHSADVLAAPDSPATVDRVRAYIGNWIRMVAAVA